jgi:hypothetical protein
MRSSGFLATRGVGVRNSGPCHERGQRILELFPSRAYPPAMGGFDRGMEAQCLSGQLTPSPTIE